MKNLKAIAKYKKKISFKAPKKKPKRKLYSFEK